MGVRVAMGLVAVRDSTCLWWVRSTVMLPKLRIENMRAVVDLIRDGDRRAPSSRYDAQLANQLARVPAAETKVALFDPLGHVQTRVECASSHCDCLRASLLH